MVQKKSTLKLLLLLTIVMVMVLGINMITYADSETVDITIGNASVAAGDECEIVLNISQAKNVGAYEFKVVYDTNNLEFVSGESLLTSSAADFYDDGVNVNVSVVLKNGISSNDSCELVKLKFKAKSSAKEGEYAVEIKNGSFADIDTYEELEYSYTKGIIYVNKLPKGDLDGNGKINVVDAMRIFHYVSGRNKELTSLQQSASDIDGNGKINIVDAMKVFHYTSGRITSLGGEGNESVSVTGVTLNKTSVAVNIGGTVSLTETVTPNNATDKNVIWSSSNTAVATVSSAGKVTAVSNGTAVITVKTADGGYTATCTVTVTTAVVPVTGVTLNKPEVILLQDGTVTLTATVTPSTASNKAVTWSSSNTAVATVSSNGTITAVGGGEATITVKTVDGSYTATCSVFVSVPVTDVVLDKSTLALNVNETATLTATILPSTASSKAVVWSSSDTSVATVDSNGKVTAKANGIATITVKSVNGLYSDGCTVTVTTKATGVALNSSSISLNPGGTATLTATVTPSTASNKNVTWSSSNTAVATVNSAGKVTAVANGTATITVKTNDGSYTAKCTITVKTAVVPVSGVSLNKTSVALNPKGTVTLTATVSPSTASDKSVTWSSSNTAVATVSSVGKVTAVANGTATITVTTTSGAKVASCTVTVTTPVTGVKLNKTSVALNVGAAETLTTTFTPSTASNKNVIWSSSNTAVATVSSAGKITAVGNGTATVTVKTTDGGYTASCTVIVTTKPTGVTLNKSSLALNPSGTATLTATVSPSTASNKNVTWSSSNTAVATVSSTGKVTAVANGTATITVKTTDGGYTASCTVTVTTKPTGVTLNKSSLALNPSGTATLTATVSPSTASNKNVTWSSSNIAVATVSSTGKVTAVANGTATITVKTNDGSYTAKCTVTVTTPVKSIVIKNPTDKKIFLDVNDTTNNSFECAYEISPSTASNKNVTWTSANTSIATVNSNGKITAKTVGKTVVTVTTKDGSKTDTITVFVYKSNPDSRGGGNWWLKISSYCNSELVMTESSKGVYIKKYTGTDEQFWQFTDDYADIHGKLMLFPRSRDLTLKPLSSNGLITQGCSMIVWEINNEDKAYDWDVLRLWKHDDECEDYYVFRVTNKDGVQYAVTATTISDGTQLTLEPLDFGNVKQRWKIEGVRVVSVTGVSLSQTSGTINVGSSTTLTATVAPTTAYNQNITWSSSNTAVATVDSNGKVIGVAAGTATITVKTVEGGKTAKYTVTVISSGTSTSTTPNLNSSSYGSSVNPFTANGYGGQCTAFVWGRAHEKLGISLPFKHNAIDFWNENIANGYYSYGSTPKANSIAVWSDGGAGHVAFVESVSGSTVIINEANFSTFKDTKYGGGYDGAPKSLSSSAMKSRYGTFKGYIYLQ